MNHLSAVVKPSEYFNKPIEIVETKDLSFQEKKVALQNWKETCKQLQESSAEGMDGHTMQHGLQEVNSAIDKLKDRYPHLQYFE